MNSGGINPAPVVPKHEKGKVLTAKYLNDMEIAIKGRTPIAGRNIAISFLDSGAVISVTGGLGLGGNPIVLNVCSNGVPSVVTLVAYAQ